MQLFYSLQTVSVVLANYYMRAVKLCTNKILQFLTGGAG